MKVLFRADASAEIGGGHISRCLSLADGLRDAGWECSFLARVGSQAFVPGMARRAYSILDLAPDEPDDPGSRHFSGFNAGDLVVVDHYGLDASYESALQARGLRVLAIDDRPTRSHASQVLLDQTFGRRREDYAGLIPADTRCLLGTDYALLRAEFSATRPMSLARRSDGHAPRRVLVSLGATDPKGLSGLVLRALDRMEADLVVDLAIGSGAPNLPELNALARAHRRPCKLHLDTTEMAGLMARADLAIGAAGTTTWERCCLGLPTALIVVAENQIDIASALTAAGAAELLGVAAELTEQDLAEAIDRLIAEPAELTRTALRASELCDGLGVSRVVRLLGRL